MIDLYLYYLNYDYCQFSTCSLNIACPDNAINAATQFINYHLSSCCNAPIHIRFKLLRKKQQLIALPNNDGLSAPIKCTCK